MNEITQSLVAYGGPVLFAVVFVEQAGVPLPSAPWLLAAGALSVSGEMNAVVAIGLSAAACLAADLLWFYVGRRGGHRVLQLFSRWAGAPNSGASRKRGLFERLGPRSLVIAKFVPGLGALMPPLAGAVGVRAVHFLWFDSLGSFLYGSFYIVAGILFHKQLHQMFALPKQLWFSACLLVLVSVPAYLAFKHFRPLGRHSRGIYLTTKFMESQMTNEHRRFWSIVAQKYDAVVDLQIGVDTRAMVRERLRREDRLGTVAEFGCGTGFYTEVLADKAEIVLATDLAPGMLAVAKQRMKAANVQFQEQDCQRTSFSDSFFDTAFMSLLIHFTDPAKTLAEMRRILKPGGTLIIANGDPSALSTLDRFCWLVRGFYYGLTRHRTKPPKGITRNLISERRLCNLLVKFNFKILCAETIRDASRSSNMPIEYIKAARI
jgi:membrane protein DedA with SNARE-associated domain/ubiquinone/menaquinone biosynthesis C-methylase UbiE